MTIIDFFCGAGGFSQGFRCLGFEVLYGYDNWKPAVETFNYNYNLNCIPKNILDFYDSYEEIENIPDTHIIVGSPPCVSFSSSNKSGTADKELGIKLTEAYLRVISVKKHKKNSILKAWFMENVANSAKYLKDFYTFTDLGLDEWAIKNEINPNDISIELKSNSSILNAANYGSFQNRKRFIAGEVLRNGGFVIPQENFGKLSDNFTRKYRTLGEFKRLFPSPYENESTRLISDTQYDLQIPLNQITDHFYDSGIHELDVKFSKHWKLNHPFMGKMSFPENEEKPSRTITATLINNSRESLIYKCELPRIGNGEFRLPTVREAAVIMGFPLNYQFLGNLATKWRLVGNAVCSILGKKLAETVLDSECLPHKTVKIEHREILHDIFNLNTYRTNTTFKRPSKKFNSRFRWHTIKDGNMTVTLSNYNTLDKKKHQPLYWYTSVQYGTGKGFPTHNVDFMDFLCLKKMLSNFEEGRQFLRYMKSNVEKKIGGKFELQKMFVEQENTLNKIEPTNLLDNIKNEIESFACRTTINNDYSIFKFKETIPLTQYMAIYAIKLISSKSNEL